MGSDGESPLQGLPLSGRRTAEGHRQVARVYYADTDFSGFVYHARYLEFFERGRSDFLRLAGIRHTELAEGGEKIVWVVRRMEIDFKAPARMDDVLVIDTALEEISGARAVMRQAIRRGAELLVAARVEAAIVSASGKPRRFPKAWLPALLGGGVDV